MKTLLLFPPQGDPFQPYSSLPALAGYLRENGRQVSLRDLNIECHHYFTTPGRLSKACFRVREALGALDRKPVLGHRDQRRYMRLAKAALYGPMVVERIGWAKKVLRSKDDFYDLPKYTTALDIFHKALELISAEYFPSRITHVSFDCGYSPDSVLEVLPATVDKTQNPYIEFYQERFVPELKRMKPDVVGISITYRHQLIPGFTLAKAVKAALPSAKIVIGGSFISSIAEKLPSCPSLFSLTDYFVVYEGEQALHKLIDCLEKGGDPSNVPNLIYCEDGEVRRSEPFVIEDLNALPTPDLDDLPLDKYLSPDLVVLLPASRGCYWRKCTFCTVSGATNKRYRQRRVDLVVEDIEKLRVKYGSPYFFFSVDVMPAKALRNLSQALIDGGVECHWQCEVRLDPAFDYNLCDLISRAGCRNLMFGMESANQRVLDMMEKGTRADEFAGILRSCNNAGIATTLFCITGFPSETVEEAEDTLNFVLRHRDVITSATFSTFQLNEGSPVQLDPERYGIVKVNKTERDLRKDYTYEVGGGQTMLEAERTRQIIDETLDQVFTRRSYFTGLHPHILIHLARFKNPKFPEMPTREETHYSEADEIGAETVLMRRTSLESRTFGFDWRDLETRLSVARDQIEFAQLEDGLTPLEAEMLVERRTIPLQRDLVRVVYDPDRDRYHFVSEGAWRVVSMFNGGRLVENILERVAPEARGKALRFIRKMVAAGLLTPSRFGDTSGVEPKGVGIRVVTRRAWA